MQIGSVEHLVQEILNMAIQRSCMQEPMPKNQASFNERAMQGRSKLGLIAQEIAKHVLLSLQAHADVQKRLSQIKAISPSVHADLSTQIQGLIHAQFLSSTPYESLVHLPRYLKAMNVRIDKLRNNLARDAQLQKDWSSLFQAWQKKLQGQKAYGGQVDSRLLEFRWQLEELRVALFAQELRTPTPISVKRLEKVLDSIQ
jgi:ATP-dependent helicase HrpA